MSIQKKFTILLLGICLFTISMFYIMRFSEANRLDIYKENIQREFKQNFDKMVQLKGSPIEILAYDYSLWDEMCAFVRNRNTKWAADNINSGINTFKADCAVVLDADYNVVYFGTVTGYGKLAGEFLQKEMIAQVLQRSWFNHFFLGTSFGLLELRTAPIQPINDTARKSQPYGYLITGRVWTTGYINDLANLTESSIKIQPISKAGDGSTERLRNSEILINKSLPGWDGKPVANMRILKNFIVIDELEKTAQSDLVIIVIAALLLFALITVSIIRWVTKPISVLAKTLKDEDPSRLRKLEDESTEFGQLARMIEASFEQKKRILNEIEVRRRAEQLHADSEEKYRNLFENSPIALWERDVTEGKRHVDSLRVRGIADPEKYLREHPEEIEKCVQMCLITNVNGRTLELHKVGSKQEFISGLWDLLTPDSRDCFTRAMIKVFEGQRDFTGETTMKTKDGEILDILLRVHMPPESPDMRTTILVSEINITELKRSERERQRFQEQLMHSNRLVSLGTLASGVAHELNNPLTGILGFSELLRDSLRDDDERKQDAREIEQLSIRCKDIISSLMTFARQDNLEAAPLNVNDVINKTFLLVEHQLQTAGISISRNLLQALPQVNGNVPQLQQVFLNIILNSSGAMHAGGQLTVSTESNNGNVVIKISDTGKGIPENVLPRIFEPFFTTKPPGQGSGMGLSLCHGIVSSLGGKIEAESKVGAGTTIIITLPALKPA